MKTLQTFDEFVKTWDGKYCEVAGSANAKNQCVDSANAYIRDVLGEPIVEWTNAIDFPSRLTGPDWQFIPNNPNDTLLPVVGDLVIWKPSPGHIAIYREGNVLRFSSFDQNFPLYSVSHIQEHTWQNVTGWIHYNNSYVPIGDTECENKLKDEIAKKDALWNEKQVIEAELNNRIEQVGRLKEEVLLEKSISNSYQEAAEASVQKDIIISQLTTVKEALQQSLNQCAKEKGAALNEVARLTAQVKLLQDKALLGLKWYKIGPYQIYIRKE